jgi:hypothetical protein
MRRRDSMAILVAAAAYPLLAHAQQAMPVIGFLNSGLPDPNSPFLAALREGLGETGYVEDKT